MVTHNAQVFARDVASALTQRMGALASPLTVTQTVDTDGYPLIRVGTGVAGDPGGLIKINKVEWDNGIDGLGLARRHFAPHRAQIVLEGNPTGGVGADVNTWDVLLPIMMECGVRGMILEIYETANTDAPSADDIAGAPTATYAPFGGYLQAL